MKVQRVLVTGGCGFVGREVVSQLKQRDCYVRVMARQRCDELDVDDWFSGDLEQPETLACIGEGVDTLIHLAGYAHATSRPYPDEIEKHRRINLEGSCLLIREAIRNGIKRVVYVSSVKAGGESVVDCLTETDERPPKDPYGQLKREAEEKIFAMCAEANVHVVVIRPALVYGPGVKGNIAAMLRAIDKGRFPSLPETHNHRSMVDVRDLAQAILLAAESEQADRRTYIITDNQAYSSRRMYEALVNGLGKTEPDFILPAFFYRLAGKAGDMFEAVIRRPMPINSTLVDRLLNSACYQSVRAEEDLGYRPQYRFEDAVPGIVEAYKR